MFELWPIAQSIGKLHDSALRCPAAFGAALGRRAQIVAADQTMPLANSRRRFHQLKTGPANGSHITHAAQSGIRNMIILPRISMFLFELISIFA